jgi:hypothetical protein
VHGRAPGSAPRDDRMMRRASWRATPLQHQQLRPLSIVKRLPSRCFTQRQTERGYQRGAF